MWLTLAALVLFGSFLIACGQRPPIETTLLPAPNLTATPFVNISVSAVSTPTDTETATPPATIGSDSVESTLEATPEPSLAPTETTEPTGTSTPTETISTGDAAATLTAAAGTPATPGIGATGTVTASVAPNSIQTTPTVSATPCFGAISGSVVADLNNNHVADAGEPGVMGATLFLRNASGIVAVYTTGNGQFNFPGLVSGSYSLSETPPTGYTSSSPLSFELKVNCGDFLLQNIFNNALNGTPVAGLRLTPVPGALTPRAPGGVASDNFTPFDVGAVYDIGGCGTLSAPGLYRLTTSLRTQWDCIQIAGDNIIFDCQGNSLNGTDMNGYGVVVHHVGNIFNQRPPRNVEIRNCHMKTHKYGIFVDAADNLYIHDNVSSSNYPDVDNRNFGNFLGLSEGGGIRVGDTRGGFISKNTTNGSAIGIDVRNSARITVSDNTASGNSAWGIHFYNVKNGEIATNLTENNVRYCTWGNGTVGAGCDAGGIMMQAGSSFNYVHNNTVGNGNGNGIFIKAHGTPCGDSNTISNNRISGALYNAIELSFCRDNKIEGNQIDGALDGIWLGFAVNNTIDAGNTLTDLTNHGIISWNSSANNVSSNRIVNSREGLYFYSADYDKQQFYFVDGDAGDHLSRGNCLCDNSLERNAVAAIHLNNSIENEIARNRLINNGANIVLEGNTKANVINDNSIQGGTFRDAPPRFEYAATGRMPRALTVFDERGNVLSHQDFVRTVWSDAATDTFDLRWFKYKLRISLGGAMAPFERLVPENLLAWLLPSMAN